MSARSAKAQARTQRKKLRDAAGLIQPELLRIEQRELEAARLSWPVSDAVEDLIPCDRDRDGH